MDILKFISGFIFVLIFISCHKNKYKTSDESFQLIYLREWNSKKCPSKIVFEKYIKNSNFKKIIESSSEFDVESCDSINNKFNQRIFKPNASYIGEINYDIKLVIDDSLEYKITNISDKTDTVYAGGHAWVIMNNIKSFIINGHKLDNKGASLSIEIPTKLAKIIKK